MQGFLPSDSICSTNFSVGVHIVRRSACPVSYLESKVSFSTYLTFTLSPSALSPSHGPRSHHDTDGGQEGEGGGGGRVELGL